MDLLEQGSDLQHFGYQSRATLSHDPHRLHDATAICFIHDYILFSFFFAHKDKTEHNLRKKL